MILGFDVVGQGSASDSLWQPDLPSEPAPRFLHLASLTPRLRNQLSIMQTEAQYLQPNLDGINSDVLIERDHA